ncbi:MAG: PAS domain-containing protein [Desulfobacterales bacterium]|nr:PAS domain-containing protein [Desulfobacterales bacterium]
MVEIGAAAKVIKHPFCIRWPLWGFISCLLLWLCPTAHGAGAPKSVLILDSYGRNVAPISTVISVFRTELSARSPEPVDIQIVSLEMARFAQPDKAQLFINFLRERFAEQTPDLVVSAGGPAAGFVTEHRNQLFPGTPVLIAGVAEQVLGRAARLDNAVVAPMRIGLRSVIEGILQLLPRTKKVAVIMGTSQLENFWVDECRKAFAPFSNRVHFEYLDQLSFEEIQRSVAGLPSDTAIFYGLMIMDKAGVLFDPAEALKAVIAEAKAPVFVLHESFFGFGAVGGRLISERAAGLQAADIALQLLGGTPAARIAAAPQDLSPPQYDWRALRRWNISENLLPPGSAIRFRQPSLWELYGGGIFAGLILLLLQTLLIARLFIQRNRLRLAEGNLAQSEQRLRQITNSLPVLIAHIDNLQRYRFLNDAYEEWFGVITQEALGRTIREVVGERFYQSIATEVTRVLTGEPVRFAKEVELDNGRSLSIEAIYVPDMDALGNVFGFYALVMDVTDRDRARQESRRLHDELLHAGRISTMGELAGALAHEINQPLSAIMSNAQAAKRFLDAADLDEVKEILPDIVNEAARAGEVIKRLRALLKKSSTTLEPVDLNAIIGEVVALMNSNAVGRNVMVVTDPDPNLPLVRGDRIQLQQVVMNLMLNAFEAMQELPRASRRIQIRTFLKASAPTVAVADTGCGVAAGDIAKIFNPYHTSKPQGMGMGLSICRGIIHRHQGRIWVEDNVDGGASFYFTLPAA